LLFVFKSLDDFLAVLQVLISRLHFTILELFSCVFLNHDFIHIFFGLIPSNCLIIGLLPHSKPSIQSSSDDVIPCSGDSKRSNLQNILLKIHDELVSVAVPKLDMSILAATDDVVSIMDELDGSHCLAVGKDSLDGMAEIHIPEANVLVDTG
jgi:hypothetical protein